jgi:hypothetical protein
MGWPAHVMEIAADNGVMEIAADNGSGCVSRCDQRVVVVCVELCVAVVSPIGETVVPLEVDVEPVTTPLTVVVFSLWLSTDAGGGVAGVVVVCVVELEEEDCAKAPPVIRATAIDAASTCLIMLMFPEIR